MALYHSPSIVTNGLVLCLDAANVKSYPGTGSTWYDLSGSGYNATLVNSPTYSNGNFVFNGTNQYATLTTVPDSFFQNNWTISFWVKFNSVSTGGTVDKVILQHGSSTTRKGLHLDQRNSSGNKIWFGLYGDDSNSIANITTNTWYNITWVLNNTTFLRQIYINGVLDSSATGAGAYTGTGSNARIGGAVLAFGTFFDGSLPACSFYNRVLTASEIQQNFNALRGRYGI